MDVGAPFGFGMIELIIFIYLVRDLLNLTVYTCPRFRGNPGNIIPMPTQYYVWQKTNDNDCADQMVAIGANMSQAPYKTLLNIAADDAIYWVASAALYQAIQKDALPDFDAFKRALTGARDALTHGPNTAPFAKPPQPAYALPQPAAGVEIRNDFFDWANVRVKQWKAIPEFTEDLQRQMGLVVPVEDETVKVPQVKFIKALSGGMIQVEVYMGGAAMAIVQLNVDGAGWPDVKVGGQNQKTLAGSHFEFQLTPGVSHSVEIREAFADRAGNMLGDWSAVKTMSSLA